MSLERVTSLSPHIELSERPLSPTATSHCALTSATSSVVGQRSEAGADSGHVLDQLDQLDDAHIHDYENLVVVAPSPIPAVPPRGTRTRGSGTGEIVPPILPTRDPIPNISAGGTLGKRRGTTNGSHEATKNPSDSECRTASAENGEKIVSPPSSPIAFEYRSPRLESCVPIGGSVDLTNITPSERAATNDWTLEETETDQTETSIDAAEEEEVVSVIEYKGKGLRLENAQGGDKIPNLEKSDEKILEKPIGSPTLATTIPTKASSVAISPPTYFQPIHVNYGSGMKQEGKEEIKRDRKNEAPHPISMFSPINLPGDTARLSHSKRRSSERSNSKAPTGGQQKDRVAVPKPPRISVESASPTEGPGSPVLGTQPGVSGGHRREPELDLLPRASVIPAATARPESGASELDYIDFHFERSRPIPTQLNIADDF